MAVFNAAFPILPGKEDAARAFATAVLAERRAGFEAAQSRAVDILIGLLDPRVRAAQVTEASS